MVAVGENVGVVRGEQIDLFSRPVSHSLHPIFLSAYLAIISRLSDLESDRQEWAYKVHSSRDSLDDRTQSRRPLGFLVCDSWTDNSGWGNLKSNGYTTSVKLARLGSSLKNQPNQFTNFFQNINSAILSLLKLVLFIELTIACWMYRVWKIGKATIGKITELALYTTMLLGIDTKKINLYEQAFLSK